MEYRIAQDEPMTNEELVQRLEQVTRLHSKNWSNAFKKKDAKILCKAWLPVASFAASMWDIKLKVEMI